jgi:hypothetical protein
MDMEDDDDDTDDDETWNDPVTKIQTTTTLPNNPGRQEEKKEEEQPEAEVHLDVTVPTKRVSSSLAGSSSSINAGGTIVVGPSQAHFYNIILERDMYKNKYQTMVQDLHNTQKKLHSTQYKLRTCNTLLELSYNNNSCTGSNNIVDNNNNKMMNRRPSINHLKKSRKNTAQRSNKPVSLPCDLSDATPSVTTTSTKTTTIPRRASGSHILPNPRDPKVPSPPQPSQVASSSSSSPTVPISSSSNTTTHICTHQYDHGSSTWKQSTTIGAPPMVVTNNEQSSPQYTKAGRPKVPILPWRRNYGIGSSHNTNLLEKDLCGIQQVAECLSYISDDEMIHKHWNTSSDKAADAIATDQYMNALLSCTPENNNGSNDTHTTINNNNNNNGTKTLSSTILPSTTKMVDTDQNWLPHRTHPNLLTEQNDDADRGAGGGGSIPHPGITTRNRVADSILFDI